MTKYIIGLVLLFAVGIVAYSTVGCDVDGAKARFDVATQKAIDEIDKMLGEWDVKRQKVVNAYDRVQEQTIKVREERVKFDVRHKRAVAKQDKLNEEKAKIKSNLGKLQKMLADVSEGDENVERNGKKVPVAKLNALAKEQVSSLELIREQMKQSNLEVGVLKKNLDVLTKQQTTSQKQLAQLKSKMKEIDTKVDTLKSMKTAQTIGSTKSINDEFNSLTDGVDTLIGELDEEMAVQEAKLDQRIADMELELGVASDIDDILNDDEDVSSTLSDIEKALQEDE
jgi:chromosome segregation ATPase